MSKLNIKALAAADTTDLQLLDAHGNALTTEDGLPVTATIFGPGSKAYAAAQARNQNRAINRLKAKGKSAVTPEQEAAETAEFLSSITQSLNNLDYDGLQGRELIAAVYGDPTLGYLAEQVNKACASWANFTKASSNS